MKVRVPPSSSRTLAATDEIGEFAARLKRYVGENFDRETVMYLIRSSLDYTTYPENISRLKSVSFIESGRVARVWEAVLKNDRPSQELKPRDSIAVKMVATSVKLPIDTEEKDLRAGLEALIRCSYLRNVDGRSSQNIFLLFMVFFMVLQCLNLK